MTKWIRVVFLAALITGLACAPCAAQGLPSPDNSSELQFKYAFLKAGVDQAKREILGAQAVAQPKEHAGLLRALEALEGLVAKLQFDANLELQALQARARKGPVPQPQKRKPVAKPPAKK